MSEIKYVIRFFKDDKYLYSVHCDDVVLSDIVEKAKCDGQTVKVVAYKSESEV